MDWRAKDHLFPSGATGSATEVFASESVKMRNVVYVYLSGRDVKEVTDEFCFSKEIFTSWR